MADRMANSGRILVAGIGNVLRCDDGFGPAVARTLAERDDLPTGVHIIELGIGGVGLIHELMAGYDALLLVDAMDRDGAAGSLYVLDVIVPEVASLPGLARHALGSDMHQAVPTQALLMARAVGALPPIVHMIGCQPAETEVFSTELSPVVQRTVPAAIETIYRLVGQLSPAKVFESTDDWRG